MRQFLQRFGTEMGREVFGMNFWVDLWETEYRNLALINNDVVVTDVRFANEALRIHRLEGNIIEIQRQGFVSDGHTSEIGIPRDLIDSVVWNASTLEDFKVTFFATVEALEKGIVNGAA